MIVRRLRVGGLALVCCVALLGVFSAVALAAPEAPMSGEAGSVTTTTATLKGGVLNPNAAGEVGEYYYTYRASPSECEGEGAKSAPGTPEVALGAEKEAAGEVSLTGLLPGTRYTFCLVERNAAEETALGSAVTFTTLAVAPTVGSAFVTDVASTSATLDAEIDPGGAETTYRFEYGNTAAYGQSTVESGLAGAGDSGQLAEAHIQGLQSSTVYHYRVVATNAQSPGGVPGPDMTFTTQPVGGELRLPDGRVWELVSPAQSEGANVLYYSGIVLRAAADGSAIAYDTTKPIEPGQRGNAIGNRVFSWRGPSGWSSRDIDIPHKEQVPVTNGYYDEYVAFSDNLVYSIVEPFGEFDSLLSPEASERTPYLRSDYANGGTSEACVNSCYRPLVTAANVVPAGTRFGGNNETPGIEEFFEPVKVVGMTPNMSSIILSGVGGSGGAVWTAGRLEPLSGNFLQATDGRVFFAEDNGIYVLDVGNDESRLLASDAAFVMASSDGSKVFFTSEGHYFQVEVESGRVTDLTPGEEVQIDNVFGHSEDDSYVYFDGVVNGSGGSFVLHDAGPEWAIGTVPSSDGVASPNGRYLAFGSENSLTGYDNRDAVNGSPDAEVYVYDADTGKLACVSCNPTGERPDGGSFLAEPYQTITEIGTLRSLSEQPRDVSNRGQVFFDSNDVLVPQDVDGTQDVYEYESAGTGSCTISDGTFSERSDGCVGLLSAGTSPSESTFLDASETGGDVFLMTAAKLTSQDPGESFVVYDAHECTSEVPCSVPPVGSPPCSTEASCRPGPTPQPSIYGAPSSATFSGAGNASPSYPPAMKPKPKQKIVKCRKSRKLSHGKCVKKDKKAKKTNRRGK